ncbi:dihydrodiol dehydrogenase [Streptomyces bathyalis]|uniref:Dihydrodiol dehydrogenase n=1 Tax=Streptomyces bathyalis TaxID=2710756 RepID=A0A7T1WQJ3_9ACTN|nr:hypothetical protein [Streptomyces bathyalis]QPP05246.1 dihydrodiol dehydrogenase [Streptomyces bathyalis]
MNPDESAGECHKAEQDIVIANEFAYVVVRKVSTRNGDRLEIVSPRLHYSIRLDALILESLTWQQPDALSTFLEDPHGPTGSHDTTEGTST